MTSQDTDGLAQINPTDNGGYDTDPQEDVQNMVVDESQAITALQPQQPQHRTARQQTNLSDLSLIDARFGKKVGSFLKFPFSLS